MAEPRSTLIDPPIEDLLDKVDSKFTLVTLASKRARQINAYFNQLGEGLGAVVPPQVTSLARKPLSIAMEEIAASKVQAGEPGHLGHFFRTDPHLVCSLFRRLFGQAPGWAGELLVPL